MTYKALKACLISAGEGTVKSHKQWAPRLYEAVGALLAAAEKAGVVRSGLEPVDLMKLIHAITVAAEKSPDSAAQVKRLAWHHDRRPGQEIMMPFLPPGAHWHPCRTRPLASGSRLGKSARTFRPGNYCPQAHDDQVESHDIVQQVRERDYKKIPKITVIIPHRVH